MNYVKELLASRELFANLTLREIRGQYKRTILGQAWSLLNPLASMLVYTFIYRFILRIGIPPGSPSGLDSFPLWLLCALLPWTFFAGAVQTGMGSLIANAGLVQKVYFNRLVLPVSIIGSIAFNWMIEMGVLTVALCAFGGWHVIFWLPGVVLIMFVLALFATGLSLMLAVANIHFRDTQYLIGIVFSIWMYLTPIIYPITYLQGASNRFGGLFGTHLTILDVYRFNPLERFTAVFRDLMYNQHWPATGDVVWCLIWAAVSFGLGLWVFRKNEKGLAEAL